MNRDAVLAVVAKNIAEAVGGLSPSAVDPARPMTDYGLGSLDAAEVISRSMHDLGVTALRREPRRRTTVGAFVDLLCRSMGGRRA